MLICLCLYFTITADLSSCHRDYIVCISYFSVADDQDNLQKKELIWSYSSKGRRRVHDSAVEAWRQDPDSSHPFQSVERARALLMVVWWEALNVPPPARMSLLDLPPNTPLTGDQVLKYMSLYCNSNHQIAFEPQNNICSLTLYRKSAHTWIMKTSGHIQSEDGSLLLCRVRLAHACRSGSKWPNAAFLGI